MSVADQFNALFDDAALEAYVSFLADLSDADRTALQRPAMKRLNEVRKLDREWDAVVSERTGQGVMDDDTSNALMAVYERLQEDKQKLTHRGMLAIAACGDAKQARRIHLWELGDSRERKALIEILLARRPRWLQTWVEQRVEQDFEIEWDELQRMASSGAIDVPTSDRYIEMMASSVSRLVPGVGADVPLSEKLKKMPRLLENEIWRLFDTETPALVYEHEGEWEHRREIYSWKRALIRLSEEGVLNRGRLLDAALSGMTCSFKQMYLAAYGKFFDAMSPDDGEVEARQGALMSLLASPVNAVVSFAMRHLQALNKRGALDRAQFVQSAGGVFQLKPKNNAVATLKLVQGWLDDPALETESLHALIISGFFHESPDTQELAISILEPQLPSLSAASRAQLDNATRFLADHLVNRLQEAPTEGIDEAPSAEDTDAILKALDGLSPDVRALVGLEHGLEAFPAPLQYTPRDFVTLPDGDRFQALESLDDVLDLTSRLLEEVPGGYEVEQLMDGIARLGFVETGDANPKVAPVLSRLLDRERWTGIGVLGDSLSHELKALLRAWLSGDFSETKPRRVGVEYDHTALHVERVLALKAKLGAGCRLPLLATPTAASGGWLDPEVLVTRLAQYLGGEADVAAADFMQAMLRLGPGNDAAALEALRKLEGKHARILRLALGDAVGPGKDDGKDAPLWLCAAQMCDYRADVIRERLAPIIDAIPAEPGQFEPAPWRWSTTVKPYDDGKVSSVDFSGGPEIEIDIRHWDRFEALLSEQIPIDAVAWPVAIRSIRALFPFRGALGASGIPWRIDFDIMQQPSITDAMLRCAIDTFALPLAGEGMGGARLERYLDVLLDVHRTWSDMGYLLLLANMACKGADYSGYAVDVLVAGIETGQADIDDFAATFARFFADNGFVLSRATSVLAAVAQVSTLHRWWVARACERIVLKMAPPPKLVRELYALMLASMVPLGMAPGAALRERLGEHKGASKTTKLAKQLIALDGDGEAATESLVIYESVRQRLALSERLAV